MILLEESILKHVRQAVGIDKDDTSFDTDILVYINSALSSLTQQGAGIQNFSVITDKEQWSDYLPESQMNSPILGMTIEFVVLQVRILFDPPPVGTQTYMEYKLRENEWRIQIEVDRLEREEEANVGPETTP